MYVHIQLLNAKYTMAVQNLNRKGSTVCNNTYLYATMNLDQALNMVVGKINFPSIIMMY